MNFPTLVKLMRDRQSLRLMILFASILVSTILVMSTIQEVQARAWGWAKRLPVNHYSAEDIEIVKKTMGETLDNSGDGQVGEWKNPDTGHAGSITPLTTIEQNGRRCRQTRFTSFIQGEENVSEFFLCKQPDGVWAVEQPANQ